jgi:MFS family permease
VLALWVLAGAGGAYQLAAAAAFIRALPRSGRARAFGIAQSGLLAAQGLGILAGGALAQRVGVQAAVALAGMLGLILAAALATGWSRPHGEMTMARSDPPPATATRTPATRTPATRTPATQAGTAQTPAAQAAEPQPRMPLPKLRCPHCGCGHNRSGAVLMQPEAAEDEFMQPPRDLRMPRTS